MATEEDKKMTENWKADANGIHLLSIQDIRQNPQETSNFYLANIYQATINSNGHNILSLLPASPPPFSSPNYVVWVNALWFLTSVTSLTCALLVPLL